MPLRGAAVGASFSNQLRSRGHDAQPGEATSDTALGTGVTTDSLVAIALGGS